MPSVETLIKITFSNEEIAQLQALQMHPHHVVRRNGLMLILKSKTIPHHKIAQITDVCENTVRHCFETYQQGGIEKIVESGCGAVTVDPAYPLAAPFVWRCLTSMAIVPFPHPSSSNPACISHAAGSRTRLHAFAHGRRLVRSGRHTSPSCWYRYWSE